MNTYRDMVNFLFEKKSNRIIANSSPEHAAILYETFFAHAEKEVCILCDNLNPDIFDRNSVIEAAKNFIVTPNADGSRRKLLIGVTGTPDPNSKFIASMKNIKKGFKDDERKKDLRIFPCPQIIADGKFVNFAIFDDCGYRFEPDSSKCSAIASVNDAPFAAKLRQVFAKIIDGAK